MNNNLTIEVYSTGTTRINDASGDLPRAQGLHFATGYPGGLYLDGGFYIPRDVLDYLPIKGNMRVVFRNGLNIVYEGWVDEEVSNLNETDQGIEIPLVGAWGRYLMRRMTNKVWADDRVREDIWVYNPTPAGEAYCDVARLTDAGPALLFQPQNLAWGSATYAQVNYTMPRGQTVAQVYGSYELATEAAATAWTLAINSGGTSLYSIAARTAAGTSSGSFSHTLGTALNSIAIRLTANAAGTPTGDGSTYAEITDLVVYGGTSAINLSQIVKDIRPGVFNSDVSYIDTITDNGYGRGSADGIIPFMASDSGDWAYIADVHAAAASFGDNSFNKWATGCLHSEMAATPSGAPVLYAEQQPALTDFDYAIRIDEPNLVAPFGIVRDYTNIWNYIIVQYYDENGKARTIDPDDGTHTALEDATSQTDYGQRDYLLNVGSSTAEAAYDSGRRFLAAFKDPQYKLSGPIAVVDYIRKKDGSRLPACEIVAGKRVKVENYLQDLSGTGLTFLISHTDYDDESETCSIQAGIPDDLIFPTFVFDPVGRAPGPSPDAGASVSSVGAGGGGGGGRLNWKRKAGLVEGTPEWDEAVKMGKMKWWEKYRGRGTRDKKKRG